MLGDEEDKSTDNVWLTDHENPVDEAMQTTDLDLFDRARSTGYLKVNSLLLLATPKDL